MDEGEKGYWAEKVNGPKPEVPQEPDIAYTVKCLWCRHTLDKHSIVDSAVSMKEREDGTTGVFVGERWECDTVLVSGDAIHQAYSKCTCSKFKLPEVPV
jgi:hypothetical protein